MLMSILIALFLTIPNQQIAMPHSDNNKTALIIKADLINCKNAPPIIKKGQVLLSVDIVKKYFDPYLYWDEKLRTIVITSKNKVIKMKPGSNTIYVNNKPFKCSVAPKYLNSTIYIPISFLKDVYGIRIRFNNDNKYILIDHNQQIHKVGKVTQLVSSIRKYRLTASPIVKALKLGDELQVYNTNKGWYKVRTAEGKIGYIESQYVKLIPAAQSKSKNKKPAKAKKVTLAWDMTLNINNLDKIDGLQILSPTWLYVSDESGTVKSKANTERIEEYVTKAHKNGYKVWAMFTNSFSPIISSSILNDGLLRDEVINQVVDYAKTYHLDGINIDFENMRSEDRDMFTQFVRELTPLLRAQGKIVSVDVGAPNGYSNYWGCYDPKELSKMVDYVAIMTYDEHWRTCPVSGSVAQYNWVEDKLQAALEEIPPSKLLLGIPFYARGWKEEKDNSGALKVTQYKVFSMQGARYEAKVNNANVSWESGSEQYYAEFVRDNAVYKIWLENKDSINLKSSLVQKYNIAGAAIWEKSYAEPDAWKVICKNVHKTKSYKDWIKANKKLYERLGNYYLCKR